MDYMDKYNFWLTSHQFDEETRKELEAIKGNDLEIKDRFYKERLHRDFQTIYSKTIRKARLWG